MGFFSKLFSFTQELAIDLGTANTIIIADGEIAVNEPSVVALDQHTEKMIAVGDTAKLMLEKTGSKIRVIRPLRDGVIADFNACEQMMRGLIRKVRSGKRLSHLLCEWSSAFPPVRPKLNSVPSETPPSTPEDETSSSSMNPWLPPSALAST